jgi:hypothetical protein
MNVIDIDVGYVDAESERGRKVPVNRDYLTSLGYPASGRGKYCVLTYDIAGAASTPITPTSQSIAPVVSGSLSIPLTGAAIAISDAITFNALTKLVRISFTGSGDVNITHDGSTPTSGVGGEVWFKGGILEVNVTTAQAIKAIKATATNSSIYVTQFA